MFVDRLKNLRRNYRSYNLIITGNIRQWTGKYEIYIKKIRGKWRIGCSKNIQKMFNKHN